MTQYSLDGRGSIRASTEPASSLKFVGTLWGSRGLLFSVQNEHSVTSASEQDVP
jgi:hypothetical protein